MQRTINKTLQLFLNQFIMIYINNIFIYSKTKIEHKIQVNKILKRLRQARLKMKIKKSIFHIQKVDFLEYVITLKKIAMKRKKLDTIIF